MKIKLKQNVIGYAHVDGVTIPRTHADEGDELQVILHNPTHYICDSKYYPGYIAVFKSQCSEVIHEGIPEDEHAEEKFYHVYEKPSKKNLDDPFYTAFESEDLEQGLL